MPEAAQTLHPEYRSYEDLLYGMAQADERIIVMTAENRAAIRGLPARLGPRFVDVGICEQTLIGAAAGLALRGRIPVVHALASFLTMRAFEFIRTDVGIPRLPVKLVGSFAGFVSEANGPTHQAIEDIALMRGIPGVNVWCPADLEDMLIGLPAILRDPAPYYIRYNHLPAAVAHTDFLPGRAEILSHGEDVTLLTYGTLFGECVRAAEILRAQGISAGLVNLRTLKPIDTEALLSAACNSRLLVAVEDHLKVGGLYSILAETFFERGLAVPALSLALDNHWFKPALIADALEYEGFTAAKIAASVLQRIHEARS